MSSRTHLSLPPIADDSHRQSEEEKKTANRKFADAKDDAEERKRRDKRAATERVNEAAKQLIISLIDATSSENIDL